MNEIFYDGDSYYLSYLATPSEFCQSLDRMMGRSHVGDTETAICIREPWKCLILYGDHREGYLPIKEDLEVCKKYWAEHQEQTGYTSDSI